MAGVVAFCDVRGALRAWAIAHPTLCGAGKPLTNGLHLTVRDSPGQGTFGAITRAGGGDHEGGMPIDTPTVQISVWGPDAGGAEAAALALCNALRGISRQTVTTARGDVVLLHLAGNVTLLDSPDGTRPRFIVSAEVWAAPA